MRSIYEPLNSKFPLVEEFSNMYLFKITGKKEQMNNFLRFRKLNGYFIVYTVYKQYISLKQWILFKNLNLFTSFQNWMKKIALI